MVIERGSRIVVNASLEIADRVYIGQNATIVAFDDVRIGAETRLGENVSIHSEDHGPAGHRREYLTSPVTVGSDVWICAGTVVTRGVTIGDRSTIGANAVVTKDIPAGVLAVGMPARVVRVLDGERAQ